MAKKQHPMIKAITFEKTAPSADIIVMDRPAPADDDAPPAFLGIDTAAIEAAEPAVKAAAEAVKEEKVIPKGAERKVVTLAALLAPAPEAAKPPQKAPKGKPAPKAPKPAKAPQKPAKAKPAPKPKGEPKARAPRADQVAAAEAAQKGVLPKVHHNFYTAPTHGGYVKRMKEIEKAVNARDLKAVRAFRAEPFWEKRSSSRDIVRRYLDNAITALTAKPAKGGK